MWKEYPFVYEELKKVENKLRDSIKTKNKSVEKVLQQFVLDGGKRLRPALTIIGGTFGQYDSDTIVSLASSIEVIHSATLIHDDIIDQSVLRRGRETVHKRLGEDTAVYCGDFLFTRAFMLIADFADVQLMKEISRGIAFVCDSEISQNESRFDQNVTVRAYLKRIMGKTAALFALSLGSGAYMSKSDEEVCKKTAKIGKNIGMAFQIIDDVLDYSGDNETFGKPVLKDAVLGVYTLPLIFALNSCRREEVLRALNNIEIDNGERLFKLVVETEGIDKARELAARYLDKALKLASDLPEAEGKKVLLDIIKTQLSRKF